MELIVDYPKEEYERLKERHKTYTMTSEEIALANGTPFDEKIWIRREEAIKGLQPIKDRVEDIKRQVEELKGD